LENGVVVDFEGVVKSFGEEEVLRGLDLEVRAGETLVIIGKSGSGKSVTIRHIVGIEEPDAGKVRVFGRDISGLGKRELNRIRLRIGYLFQSGALLNWLTVAENVALPLLEHRRRLRAAERRKIVLEKLRLVEMENAADKYPAEISGGMKKRAAFARAVILDPEIILYDEPTAGLDPVIASTINDIIIRTAKTLHPTQIVVTHDMESANRIADRIAMLYGGKIIAVGTPEEIQASKDPVVQQFITGATEGPLSKENPS
jgi:phospholipid/cholesterol/gamma-HCH transport system ATP-binding protein